MPAALSSQITNLPIDEGRYQDSLQKILISGESDSIKANACFLLSNFWYRKDVTKGDKYLNQAKVLSKNNAFQQAIYYYYHANLLSLSNIAQAEDEYMKCDKLLQSFKTRESYAYLAKVWHNYGVQQQKKDNQTLFADILLNKSIPYAIKGRDSIYLGKNYFDLGLAFKNVGQFDKVEKYCNIAIDILKKIKAPDFQLIIVYNASAENFVLLNKNKEAKYALNLSKNLLNRYPESQYYLDYYISESMYNIAQGKFDFALASVEKGIDLAKKLNLPFYEQRFLLQKFYAYYGQRNFKQAELLMINLLKNKEMTSMTSNRLQMYYGLEQTYVEMGKKDIAYNWLKLYSQLSDSVSEIGFKSQVNDLEIKYKAAENEKKIVRLNAERDNAYLKSKNNQLINLILGGVIFCLLIVSIFIWLYYVNAKKLIIEKEKAHVQSILVIKNQKEIDVMQAMASTEDLERKRIARDLHDGIGSMLSSLKMKISHLKPNANNLNNIEVDEINNLLNNSIIELNQVAYNMVPETLLKLGLKHALSDLCYLMQSEKIHILFQDNEIAENIAESNQITIYRIIQELVNNALKHSNCTEIIVDCSQNQNIFFITVEDNGIGFNEKNISSFAGSGLKNLQNRIKLLHGKFEVKSALDNGTVFNIELVV